MRKIEHLMNEAITNGLNWKCGNTKVVTDQDNVSSVYLHNNLIAKVGDDWVQLFDGGWQSNTTKSRLNAILKVHAIDGECVVQKNFKWFVHKFIGQWGQTPVFNVEEFSNGLILS